MSEDCRLGWTPTRNVVRSPAVEINELLGFTRRSLEISVLVLRPRVNPLIFGTERSGLPREEGAGQLLQWSNGAKSRNHVTHLNQSVAKQYNRPAPPVPFSASWLQPRVP